MPFKTAVAAAATKEQPPSDVLAVLENSQSEMQLLALWQGGGERNKQSRVDQYASAVGLLLSFLRASTPGPVLRGLLCWAFAPELVLLGLRSCAFTP